MTVNRPAVIRPAAVIVLAAGEGRRMRSRTPKMLHEIGGVSLLGHAVRAARALGPEHLAVVVGHGRDRVVPQLAALDGDARAVVQAEQNGTAHAVRTALAELPRLRGAVVVTCGDVPLLAPATVRELLADHAATGAAATLLTAAVADPAGYGRVLRDASGAVTGIVEDRDASPEEREIAEVNSGIYAFDAVALADALTRVKAGNSQGEEYLTDVVGILREEGKVVGGIPARDPDDILGVNDRVQLAELNRIHNARLLDTWMRAGVTVLDPQTTWVEETVTLEPDATLYPQTSLRGTTTVAAGAVVGPDTTLVDTVVGPDARVVRTHADGAQIGADASVGPFAYLRPGTRLAAGGKIGTFVETKQARIGAGTKVPHLTYVGDATLGEGTNIGAGTIFANYDGVAKHHTTVGAHCFVGSDAVLVAPVEIADGVYVAAGSTIVKDVGPGALAVARGQQRSVEGWVARKRAGTPTAEAADRALRGSGDTGTDKPPGGSEPGGPESGGLEPGAGRSAK